MFIQFEMRVILIPKAKIPPESVTFSVTLSPGLDSFLKLDGTGGKVAFQRISYVHDICER